MTELSILFSAPMVRAILDGRKTVTRRPIKTIPWRPGVNAQFSQARPFVNGGEWRIAGSEEMTTGFRCPYGTPGDRLWVKETWGHISNCWNEEGNLVGWVPDRPATKIREMRFGNGYLTGHAIYRADGECEWAGDDDGGGDPRSAWKPSIHMPRLISRITLEVTEVRIERLQAISRLDAADEGAMAWAEEQDTPARDLEHGDERIAFQMLWETINGADSWDANPWVWAIEFRRLAV
jgi:hypothetical protein